MPHRRGPLPAQPLTGTQHVVRCPKQSHGPERLSFGSAGVREEQSTPKVGYAEASSDPLWSRTSDLARSGGRHSTELADPSAHAALLQILDNAITLVSTRPTATWTPQRELFCRTFGAGWLARPTKPATAGQILTPAGGINHPGLDIGQVAGARPARSEQARLLDRGSVPGRSARRSWPRPVTCAGSPPPSPWSSSPAGHRGSGCPPSSPARPASPAPVAPACAWPPADRRAWLVGRRVRYVL